MSDKNSSLTLFEFDSFCASCKYYGTTKCEHLGKTSGLTRWDELGCKKFKS